MSLRRGGIDIDSPTGGAAKRSPGPGRGLRSEWAAKYGRGGEELARHAQ